MTRSRGAPIAAVAVACAAAACNAWMRQGQLLGPVEDETLLVPIAMKTCGLASFEGDKWLATVAPVFSVPYSWIVGTLLRLIDDPVIALRWLALPFHAVFLLGTWRLAERLGGRTAGIAALVLCVIPPFGPLVLAPGTALPRDLVFALVPWFVLGADALRDRPRKAGLLFLGLGLAANLHPLTALHAALWLLAIELFRDPSAAGLRATAVRGAAFAVGASPYVVQYLSLPPHPGAVDETVYAWRLGPMAGETWAPWLTRMEPILWLTLAATVAGGAAKRAGTVVPRWLVVAAILAVVLAAAGSSLGVVARPLRALQFARFERMAVWSLVVVAAAGAAGAIRVRAFGALAVSTALASMALLGPLVLGDDAGRGPLGRLGRKIDRDAGIPFEPPAPDAIAMLRSRPGFSSGPAHDPTAPEASEAFLRVCRFAREKTPENAVFLVPPEYWGPFRVYARRGVVVTRKEGGAALSFLGASGMDWFRDYWTALNAYEFATADAFAAENGASYAVIPSGDLQLPGKPVADAYPYRVHAVPTK